jgi:DNA polymerase
MFADPERPDMYQLAYARSFGVPDPKAISKADRQLGKIQELALQYEGGVGAFVTFVLTYKMDLNEVAAAVLPKLDPVVEAAARETLAWRRRKKMTTYGLADDVFVACEALKALWRAAHPATASYWPELVDAAIRAIQSPNREFEARRIIFDRKGVWLRAKLPSGNYLCYPDPKAESVWTRDDGLLAGKLSYLGVSPTTHQWKRIGTYGGKFLENADQSFSRDVLFYSMPDVEAAGYEIIMRVHDEFITEAPDDPAFNAKHLSSIIVNSEGHRRFTEGLPLAADGFEAYRYKKDD